MNEPQRSTRRVFAERLCQLAGDHRVNSIGITWHDIDEYLDEFLPEEGLTITVKKDGLEYVKNFFGADCMKAVPKKLLAKDTKLTVTEYNTQRMIEEMGIK